MPERVPLMPVRPSCHASDPCLPCLGIILRTFLEHLVLFWGGLPLGEVVKKGEVCAREESEGIPK